MGCFSSPKQKIQQAETLTPQQSQTLGSLLNIAAPGGIPANVPSFPGQRLAPLSSLQQQGFDIASQIPGVTGAAQGLGFDALQQILSGSNQDFFGPAQESAQRLFENVISPNVLGRFAQTGSANSGAARRALSEAGRDVSLGLSEQLSQFGLQRQGQQINALPQLANLAGLGGQAANQLLGFGSQQQAQRQGELGVAQDIFREQQPLFNPAFGMAAQLAGIPSFENVVLQKPGGLGVGALSGLGQIKIG